MGSHRDDDFAESHILESLRREADELTRTRANEITAGAIGEKPIRIWSQSGVEVHQLPDDKHGILRISVGGLDGATYCAFRGSRTECLKILRDALRVLSVVPKGVKA